MGGLVRKVTPGDWSSNNGAGKERKLTSKYKQSAEERKKRDQRFARRPGRTDAFGSTIIDETLG